MTIRILNRTVAALSAAVILSACGGGGDSAEGRASDPSAQSQGLVYAFPGDGQTEVSTASPVILRFTSSVNVGDAMNGITLYEGGADGRAMSPEFEPVQGQPNNLMLVPEEDDPFKPNQQYTLVIEDLPLGGNGTAENRTLQFTTRALHEGPKELVVTDMDDFRITGAFPNFDNDNLGGEQRFQAMDFSSFRFQMSQPVDRATAVYGESVTLTYGPDDTEVPATLLVDGRYLTVDPEPEYLDPSQTYELTLTGDLASTYGANFAERSLRFKPQDTSPRGEPTRLVQRLTVNEPSKLTGRDVNTVPVNGTLLGEDENVTQARADSVIAELGDATVFSRTTPIRLPKGTVLKGDAINPILIGGKVPAGFGSGEVTMTLLSDATGYLVQNRYMEDGENVSRMIQLMMDVGIATAEPRANGAFTQDLLHIELVGLADIDTSAGVLNVDAVSVVEPDILGQEYGYGLLSFQLQSYEDQTNAPQPMADTTAPTLQSWMPQNREPWGKAVYQKPGDPIVLTFDEQLEKVATEGLVKLYKNGNEVPVEVTIDGASVVVSPQTPISYSAESSPDTYTVEVSDGIIDFAGNAFSGFQYDFQMPTLVEQVIAGINANFQPETMYVRAPIVSAIYPGYPCVTDEGTRDLSSLISGRCIGGVAEPIDQGIEEAQLPASDLLPVMPLPQQRPVIVNFSKRMNLDSISLGNTFLVQEVDEQGGVIADVAGNLHKEPSRVTFVADQDWAVGSLYKVTLKSNGDFTSSACNPQQSICSEGGLPLQTQILGVLTRINNSNEDAPVTLSSAVAAQGGGGQDMENFFVGAAKTTDVLQNLTNLPNSDVNSNFFHDANRTVEEPPNPIAPYIEEREYAVEEYGPTNEPDPLADQTPSPTNNVPIDLNGVLAPPNAAKVLSKNTAGLDFQGQAGDPETLALNNVNVGCGFQSHMPFDPENPVSYYAIPLNCPKQKFVYISGNLNADVTNRYDEQRQALAVNIWPGQLVATSLIAYTRLSDTQAYVPSESGPQIMRMRYAEDGMGNRNQPIVGWITEGDNGPQLEAEVDLYVDIPELQYNLFALSGEQNIHSYPITLKLTGGIEFLDDGRMTIEQVNINAVDIDVRIFSSGNLKGVMNLLLPEGGTRLNYISEPIKK